MSVLRRMGVLDEIRRLRTDPGPWRLVDARGDQVVGLPVEFAGGEVEILRGDLARVLYDLTGDDVKYVFGDSIASMTETPDGVEVTFRVPRVRADDQGVRQGVPAGRGQRGLVPRPGDAGRDPAAQSGLPGAHRRAADRDARQAEHQGGHLDNSQGLCGLKCGNADYRTGIRLPRPFPGKHFPRRR
ncbi:hypothetical protein ACFYYP_33510 [Microbispora rosea]|uniref:hypothetical protein n=1 Tax=Microbispora rosea TaxID=58117 RepID=UPI0036840E2C